MAIDHVRRAGELADTLRSLGALLDAHRADGVVIHETDSGLVVRALLTPLPGMPPDTRRVPLERVFDREEMLVQRLVAIGRRGSGQRAEPIERALRVLGGLIEARGLADLTIAQQHEQAWLLWYRSAGATGIESMTLDRDDIERLDAAARERLDDGVMADVLTEA